jgi:hypothetical protein
MGFSLLCSAVIKVTEVYSIKLEACKILKINKYDLFIYITRCLKGQFHEMEISFEGLNILFSTFCVCAYGFSRPFKSLSLRYTIINFTFPFSRSPFFVIGQFSLVPTYHWLQGKCARINRRLSV